MRGPFEIVLHLFKRFFPIKINTKTLLKYVEDFKHPVYIKMSSIN